jgi:phosphatidylserine decarboxylase
MLIASAILIVSSFFISKAWISIPLAIIGLLLAVFTIWFFRDPERNIPDETKSDKSIVLSPADGKVIDIIEIYENKYMKTRANQISIFLSPLDVHVNRSPVSGNVEYYHYRPGQYLVAYHPKSSELNEHSLIGVNTQYGKMMFKQIVGIVARRLVCELKIGDSLNAGDRFGMMKFGSRMDIILPLDAEITTKIGDRVVAGETIIARMNKLGTDNK